ncbi:hypothetical protein ACLK1Z_22045 [Escherichia coli]
MAKTAISFTIAKRDSTQTAGKHYPAPITAVKTIEAAARFGREEALNLENKSFVRWRIPTNPRTGRHFP